MRENKLKLKKGGLDTIVAYIVVMLPLFYVVVYMVATIYHFSVQTYMSQVIKEATVMVSTFGDLTTDHETYINSKLANVLGKTKKDNENNWEIKYYLRDFDNEKGIPGELYQINIGTSNIDKADIIGIQVTSVDESLLGKVGSFNIFGGNDKVGGLYYTAYREEIIRNEKRIEPK